MAAIAVLDIGSTSAKGMLVDENGSVLATMSADYPTHSPYPGWMEQDPDDWWAAACQLLRGLGAHTVPVAVGLTGSMQNLIMLDRNSVPVRPAILYSDTRADDQSGKEPSWSRPNTHSNAAAIIGNTPDPFMPIAKLPWLSRHEPGSLAKTQLILSCAKDMIALKLTDTPACDPTAASTVGLMDLARRAWSQDLLDAFGLPKSSLPPIINATAVVGSITKAAAAECGLPAGIPVVNGCGDAGATSLGAGADAPGESVVYLGTSGWIAVNGGPYDPAALSDVYTLAHPTGDGVIDIAPLLTAGDAVAWARSLFATASGGGSDQSAEALAADQDLSGMPLFLPYLGGERSPFVDTAVRGAFLGLDRRTTPADLKLSVLEGVAFAIRHNMESLPARTESGQPDRTGANTPAMRLVGGGAASTVWPQIIADTCNRPIEIIDTPVGATALGACRLAAAAMGMTDPFRHRPPITNRFTPRTDRRETTDRRYQAFLQATAGARTIAPLLR